MGKSDRQAYLNANHGRYRNAIRADKPDMLHGWVLSGLPQSPQIPATNANLTGKETANQETRRAFTLS